MPEVVVFYRITGDIDYPLKLQVADIADNEADPVAGHNRIPPSRVLWG